MNIKKEFDIAAYIALNNNGVTPPGTKGDEMLGAFYVVCDKVKMILDSEDAIEGQEETALERQRRALIGAKKEVVYYKNKIKEILIKNGMQSEPYPEWYSSIESAVFCELLGFAGIENWIAGDTVELAQSSSCKIIGDRIYYLIDGKSVLQPQKISADRRAQLKETLLLPTPEKNRSLPYYEVYLTDGTRVTIFNDNGMSKKDQDCIVFRKYAVNTYTFEEQAERHTIPADAIPLLESMVKVGFNVAFTGPVRSAKTTFLATWQSYENCDYEGLMIETDPEIPLHLIMPTAPIMQLTPNDAYLDRVITTAKRSDAKYIIIGEARDGKLLNIAVEAANMGTRRSKMTFHNSDTVDFCYDVADKIVKDCGGSLSATMIKVAKSFQYIFNFEELSTDQSQKRLVGIWEIYFNRETLNTEFYQICKYDYLPDSWCWNYNICEDKIEIGKKENWNAYLEFKKELEALAAKFPGDEEFYHRSPYDNLIKGGQ